MSIGIDILNLKKIKLKENLISRILSEKELEIFNRISNKNRRKMFFSTIWVAKECIFKLGINNFSYKSLTILHDEKGKPYCLEYPDICLSISHEKKYTIGVAFIK